MRATQASIGRAIAAAHKAGLYVVAIRPDGTIVVGSGTPPTPEVLLGTDPAAEEWTTFRA